MFAGDNSARERYAREQDFFDALASNRQTAPMPKEVLDRYAAPRRPHLFSKEFMFSLLEQPRGKRLLEIGCGDGAASVQLAYAGADVTAVDLSPKAIEIARGRAKLTGVHVDFRVANIETDAFEGQRFDVVWCDCILHHVVPNLDSVVAKVHAVLVDGGLFITREPVAYARWLKAIRRVIPVASCVTPDEQPLRGSEFRTIERYFPRARRRYFRVLARIDCVTDSLQLIAATARVDNLLLWFPGVRALAGSVVLWARK
jgi:2-polyprenyl-3-methyl-5-hydroxy-6-metoxy-1,4-benzoquinol methylase